MGGGTGVNNTRELVREDPIKPTGYSPRVDNLLAATAYLSMNYTRFLERTSEPRDEEPIKVQRELALESVEFGDREAQDLMNTFALAIHTFPAVNDLYTMCWRDMPVFMRIFLPEELRPKTE